MPRATRASRKSRAPRRCRPRRSRIRSASSGPLASSVKRPNSTAASSTLEPQKPSPVCMIRSGVGELLMIVVSDLEDRGSGAGLPRRVVVLYQGPPRQYDINFPLAVVPAEVACLGHTAAQADLDEVGRSLVTYPNMIVAIKPGSTNWAASPARPDGSC